MTAKKILQSFAINNSDELVSIRDVDRGKACHCICPVCRESLIARQGDQRAWHFAHTGGYECERVAETALHLAAKQVLAKSEQIIVPRQNQSGPGMTELIPVVNPRQEETWHTELGLIVPDVAFESDGCTVFAEIAVTHPIDATKKMKIEATGVPTIEIYLDHLAHEEWTWDLLEYDVLSEPLNRQWVYYPTDNAAQSERVVIEDYLGADSKNYIETRMEFGQVPIRLRRYAWGVTIWSGFDLEVNRLIKVLAYQFNGRWTPKFKTWSLPRGVLEILVDKLINQGAVLLGPQEPR